MQITPRYGNQAVITMDATFPRPDRALAAQRRRQEELFSQFGPEHWSSSTRCDAWNVRDVVAHLVTVNRFWSMSIRAGLEGRPTTVLNGFDPARHPAMLVDDMGEADGPAVLEDYRTTNAELVELVTDLPPEAWSRMAESPVGHVAIDRVVDHAMWDAWVHEHDIRIPHKLDPVGDDEELAACLRYAAALGPALGGIGPDGFAGTVVVHGTDPEQVFTVEVSTAVAVLDRGAAPGTPILRGRTVDLIEALSLRAPRPLDAPVEVHQMLRGLTAAFSS
ncbi:MAG: maleylpyruvate isomerase family mycothiol-dependent enzyme [Actinobacteria bacterium]|nr:maleylpyruvate isomerase family mycothiol-dependent enzyme [Actinomycetota bacterium]